MENALLRTKLYIPKPRPGVVGRSRLLTKLDEGLTMGRPLSLISAPAGYGKTTLVADWLNKRDRPQAWLSLDEHDNDPARFFSYLIAALQTIDKNIGQEADRLLSGSGMLPVEALVVTLINEILTAAKPLILVLDDFHVISHESIFAAVQDILDSHPPDFHIVMVTREDPALSLPRLRVRNQMTEIRMDDLRFDNAETGNFLATAVGDNLKEDQVSALLSRTEGWIAGLQLAAISIKGWGQEQVNEFISTFSGNHRYIIDYLMEEVISRTDDGVREFLTRTSIMDRFNAELGDELTGKGNGKAIIARLEQTNLFVIPLDSERKWYRYHHLFGEFLRTELTKMEQREIHCKACLWFTMNGLQEEGIKHALAAGEYDLAARLLCAEAGRVFQRGEVVTLLKWLNSLPQELVEENRELVGYKAWSLFLLGKSEETVHFLTRAERIMPEYSNSLSEGRLLALQGWIANYREDPRTKEIAQRALNLIGEQDPFFREIALLSLGHVQRKIDPMEESTSTLREAYDTARTAGHMFTSLVALLDITMNLVIQGQRRESIAICNRALQDYVDSQGKPLPLAELLYIPLGILLYEGNELEEARSCLEQGIAASHRLGLNRILGGDAEQTLALAHWALGDAKSALELLEKAKANTDAKAFPLIKFRFEAFETLLLLKQGDLAGALVWVERYELSPTDCITSLTEIPYIVFARILYSAKQYDQALELLANLRTFDREKGRYGRLVYVNLLTSLVLQAQGRQEEAQEALEQTVGYAAKEGYVRPFLGEGPKVKDLLLAVETKAPEFITSLVGHFSSPSVKINTLSTESSAGQERIEQLSERELEVLRLLAAGLSNDEIGNKLFISLGTVKWHIKNIFGKLEVKSRTQAVARAQQLGILGFSEIN